MRTITKTRSSAKYMNDVNTVERCGIHHRSRSYAHKTEINGLNIAPRATDAVATQISVVLNRIRTESCR